MRNRDSALRSRERKKVYVKELEMKSKYLEGECKRLEYALSCCVMENQILYQRLQHKGKAFDVSSTKQESAVLPLGTKLVIFFLVEIGRLFEFPNEGIIEMNPDSLGLELRDSGRY